MKKLVLFSVVVLWAAATLAQGPISLTQGSFSAASYNGPDTIFSNSSSPVIPILSRGAAFIYNLASVAASSSLSQLYRVGTSLASFGDSVTLGFGGLPYNAKLQENVSATSYAENGQQIYRKAYGLAAYSAAAMPTDSLLIIGQNITYTVPRVKIQFPATYGSFWASAYKFDLSFALTFTPLSYNHAPGVVRTYATELDTVTGYGKMSVQDKNGHTSIYYDVLQVTSIVSSADSFFVNGAPAPQALLTSFGIVNGKRVTSTEQYYYRNGELTPLVYIAYDSTYPQAQYVQTHAARIMPNGIAQLAINNTLNIYPNPVSNGNINISATAADYGEWDYTVTTIAGQIITAGKLHINASQSVNCVRGCAPGTYILRLTCGTKQAVKQLLLQ